MASPAYELSTDTNGNTVLVPAATPVSKPRGFLGDVASKAREYFSPRVSDFTEGTAAAYGAGKDISQRGYENFKTNPLYGAGQIVGGSALSAISPLAGATEYFTKPVGRTLGPAPEHAAEVASMFTPLPSKGASMFKFRPKPNVAPEFANIPREFSHLPRDMQETLNAMPAADREQVFAVLREGTQAPVEAARAAAPSAASEAVQTARTISPIDLAVQQNRYPGRFVNPQTGQAQSVSGASGRMEPAMGAIHDPIEAVAQNVPPLVRQAMARVMPDGRALNVQNVRMSNGTIRNLAPNAQTVVKTADGNIVKLGPGESIPQGATVLNATEAPMGKILGYGALGFGAPTMVALGNVTPGQGGPPAQVPVVDPGSGAAIAGSPAVATPTVAAPASVNEVAQQAAIDAMRGRDEFNQTAPNTFNQQEAIRIASTRPEFNQSWSNQVPVRPAASTASAVRSQQAAPTPMMRPESSPSPKDSILSRIFSGQDYQSSGPTRGDNRLYQGEKDGRKVINWGDPESAADFFRASKAQQDWNAQNPDSPSIGAGMKRGGAANAKPGKDEAVHKALDIIQHLLMRH